MCLHINGHITDTFVVFFIFDLTRSHKVSVSELIWKTSVSQKGENFIETSSDWGALRYITSNLPSSCTDLIHLYVVFLIQKETCINCRNGACNLPTTQFPTH